MNKAKYRLTCKAQSELTEFNKEFNKSVETRCVQTVKYEPHISCVNHEWKGDKGCLCPYIEIKKAGK